MAASRMGWAAGVVAPWCLAVGLLVSITADAGQAVSVGGSFAGRTSRALPEPDDLVPVATLTARRAGDFASFAALAGGDDASRMLAARYAPGSADDFRAVSEEVEPRRGAKRTPGAAPTIDRSNKGDPTLDLRPSFDSQLRRRGGPRAAQLFGAPDETMPTASFSLADEGAPLDGATSFAPYAAGEDMQGDALQEGEAQAEGVPPEGPGGEASTLAQTIAMRPAALRQRLAEGATPKVSSADALSSTTPAPADGAPVAAVFGRGRSLEAAAGAAVASLQDRGGHRDYRALLAGADGARERRCLAEAVYFEARSEPEEGQAAVAQVVLNRAASGLYPASVCGVVYQNRSHFHACQFSFACEGKSLRITEPDAWRNAQRIAEAVASGDTYLRDVGGATHYHANYVRPYWARQLVKMDVIGHHVFYKLRGQS